MAEDDDPGDLYDFLQDAQAGAADDVLEAAAEAEAKAERDDAYEERFRWEEMDGARDEWEAERLVADLRNVSIEKAQEYLGTYGDAIYERIDRCLSEGNELLRLGHFGPALTMFASSMEVALGFLVLRPLMQGAFLVDEWAETLTNRILQNDPSVHRRLLPTLVTWAGIELDSLRLPDNSKLWPMIKAVFDNRNAFVHEGRPVEQKIARSGSDSALLVINGVIVPLARHLRMSWPAMPWHRSAGTYSPSPFPTPMARR